MNTESKNKQGKTWAEYDKEIAHVMKNYLLIKVSKAQYRTAKSMWRKGYDVSDITSYIILSAK